MNTTILQLKEEVQALFKTLGLDLSKLERENKKYGCVFLPGTFCVEMSYRGRRQWHPTPVLLPGKSHGLRSLVGYSPFTFYHLSCCCCCSVAKQRLTLWNPIDCSTPGSPVLHCLPEFSQIYVH